MKPHVNTICVKEDCNGNECDERHPRQCRFYTVYGRCKFHPCAYMHVEKIEVQKIKHLEEKLVAKEIEIQELNDKLNGLLENIEKQVGLLLCHSLIYR